MDMVAIAADISLVILALSLVLAFVRLLRGPDMADRVVALDLMSTIGVCIAAVYAIRHEATVLLDIAIVLALIAFIGTVAFARYLERGETR
jgi:multicomponent Na+:H+ antiporter subunit F